MKRIMVEVQPDHLQSLAGVKRPISAVTELIWNGFDADATEVRVDLAKNDIDGLRELTVSDNGNGLPYEMAEDSFQKLGGSWKKHASRTPGGRLLHGQLGKGRFKAFGIGSAVTWTSRYKEGAVTLEYSIAGTTNRLGEFDISDCEPTTPQSPGMSVDVALQKNYVSLMGDGARNDIAEEFALYLLQYPDATLIYDGWRADPSPLIRNLANYNLEQAEGESPVTASLTVIEWNRPTDRGLFLCDEEGVTLHKMNAGIHAPGFDFTAYLKSPLIRQLDASGNLLLEEMDPTLNGLLEQARKQLKDHFRQRAAESTSDIVEEWKKEEIYPYQGEAISIVERAERQIFDVVALNINSYLPDFEKADKQNKKLSLRLIKKALENDPGELQQLLDEILNLPIEKRKELAELLRKTTLSSIITASKIVSDRLNFIRGLEILLFEKDNKQALLERSQLHRILASETWIFGEEFHITVDDQSLDEVLAKHMKLLRDEEPIPQSPALDEHGSVAIVDLMLSKRIPLPNVTRRQHLIIELKRPSQKIDPKVQSQVIKYATAVSNDERFKDTNTEWHFLAISNEMDDSVRLMANQANREPGLILDGSKDGNFYVWAKTWGQIIQDCKGGWSFSGSACSTRRTGVQRWPI